MWLKLTTTSNDDVWVNFDHVTSFMDVTVGGTKLFFGEDDGASFEVLEPTPVIAQRLNSQ